MKTLRLLLAWTWVSVPLAWGVQQSLEKSLPLFRGSAAASPVEAPDEATLPSETEAPDGEAPVQKEI